MECVAEESDDPDYRISASEEKLRSRDRGTAGFTEENAPIVLTLGVPAEQEENQDCGVVIAGGLCEGAALSQRSCSTFPKEARETVQPSVALPAGL